MNTELEKELIKRLETRLKQLTNEINLGYPVTQAHHLRDTVTILACLKGEPQAKQLVSKLPIPPAQKFN